MPNRKGFGSYNGDMGFENLTSVDLSARSRGHEETPTRGARRPLQNLCTLRPENLKSRRVPPPWRCQEKTPAPRPQTGGPQLHYTALSRVRPCNSTGVWAVCISTNCRHTGPYHPLRLGLVTTTELSIQCQPQSRSSEQPKQPDRLRLAIMVL